MKINTTAVDESYLHLLYNKVYHLTKQNWIGGKGMQNMLWANAKDENSN